MIFLAGVFTGLFLGLIVRLIRKEVVIPGRRRL